MRLKIPWQKDGDVSIHMCHFNPILLGGEKRLRLSPGDIQRGDATASPKALLPCLTDHQKLAEITKNQNP